MDGAPGGRSKPRDDCDEGSKLFLNWQLSQLEFNWRVLAQAQDTELPLLERLKFLCIP